MNKSTAQQIARSGHVTWGELQETIRRAYHAGAANDQRAKGKVSFTRAVAYNLFCGWASHHEPHEKLDTTEAAALSAQRILYEFGEFWQGWQPEPKPPKESPPLAHRKPIPPPF